MSSSGSPILVLNRREVESVLDADRLRKAIAAAMVEVSAGRVSMPNRVAAVVSERDALLGVMPAYLPASAALATKLVSLFPRNRDRPTHQAILVCFDAETGTPTALMDATAITAARTAAGSALSVELLARDEARTLAIVGTGVQAVAHADAVMRVRPFERLVIAGRSLDAADRLARTLEGTVPRVEATDRIEETVRGADVVCAATHADRPVVRWPSVRPGAHITSVGFNTQGAGEVDRETVVRSALFVESRAAALAEPPAGAIEITRAIADGAIDPSHVRAEIGEVAGGTASGRRTEDEVTLYKSVGVAAQDAAAAAFVLAEAERTGVGREIEL